MIPFKYRERLPPYWYENNVAEIHFSATGQESSFQREKIQDIGRQFILPQATYSLDIWDWIYFNEIQVGGHEERRLNIIRKRLSSLPFTLETLRSIGKGAGDLTDIEEDFLQKGIKFHFKNTRTVQVTQLLEDFEVIRPVHVKKVNIAIFDLFVWNMKHQSRSRILSRSKFPSPFLLPIDGTAPIDGTWSSTGKEILHRMRYGYVKRHYFGTPFYFPYSNPIHGWPIGFAGVRSCLRVTLAMQGNFHHQSKLPMRLVQSVLFPGPNLFPIDGTVPVDGKMSFQGGRISVRERIKVKITRINHKVASPDWTDHECYPIKTLPVDGSWAIQGIGATPLQIEQFGGTHKSKIQVRRKDGVCIKRMVIV
ncbi:hypothetical protein J5TS2_38840 [Brevibacillus halotolerans]|uniref:hypothetical protein n=1 Tax=Brevibacillus halotolerans TaxID=1507437 RepID=UPI001B02A98D|nr:hypothetical protein [Brevibacillus halotolerans]GIO03216.1 hypothetical protein J5TS2_38840 [Brevibacillus halotolerans]